jgi:hypothetical protein
LGGEFHDELDPCQLENEIMKYNINPHTQSLRIPSMEHINVGLGITYGLINILSGSV